MSLESELRDLVAQVVREVVREELTRLMPQHECERAPASPSWLNVRQLAEYLAMPVNTLNHWRKNARGPRHHKIGCRVLYAKADADAWIASRAVGRVW